MGVSGAQHAGWEGRVFDIRWIYSDVLNVRLSGFFSMTDVVALEVETQRLLVHAPSRFYGLAEISLLPVQRPEIVLRLRDLLSVLRAAGMANGAIVVTSVLVKLQARRAVDPERTGYFSRRSEALVWLAERRASSDCAETMPAS